MYSKAIFLTPNDTGGKGNVGNGIRKGQVNREEGER